MVRGERLARAGDLMMQVCALVAEAGIDLGGLVDYLPNEGKHFMQSKCII